MTLIDAINFDVFLAEDEPRSGMQFPPTRFDTRDARLKVYDNLRRGDLSAYLQRNQVVVNLFRAYSSRVANLVMMSDPVVTANPMLDLHMAGYDAIYDMVTYGGAVVRWDAEMRMMAHDPPCWYPREDGAHVFIRPYVSTQATDSQPDRANVVVVEPSMRTISHTYGYDQGGILGQMYEDDTMELPASVVEVVPRAPQNGIWGESKYSELLSPVVEIAKRYSMNSRLLDRYGRPIPSFNTTQFDPANRYPDLPAKTDPEYQSELDKRLSAEFDDDVVDFRSGVSNVQFMQPNVSGVTVALSQIMELRQEVNALTGLPSFSGESQPPSGEAMKRMYLPLYAETMEMMNALRGAFERLLGVPIEWTHVFDAMEAGDAEARETMMQQMMSA